MVTKTRPLMALTAADLMTEALVKVGADPTAVTPFGRDARVTEREYFWRLSYTSGI